jgi:hypothetical protein
MSPPCGVFFILIIAKVKMKVKKKGEEPPFFMNLLLHNPKEFLLSSILLRMLIHPFLVAVLPAEESHWVWCPGAFVILWLAALLTNVTRVRRGDPPAPSVHGIFCSFHSALLGHGLVATKEKGGPPKGPTRLDVESISTLLECH